MSHHLIIAANSGSLDKTPDAVDWSNIVASSALGNSVTATNSNNTISAISTSITLAFSTTLAYTGEITPSGIAYLELYKNGTASGNVFTGNSTSYGDTGLTVSATSGDQFYFKAYLPEPGIIPIDTSNLNGTVTIKNQSMSNTVLDTFDVTMSSTHP